MKKNATVKIVLNPQSNETLKVTRFRAIPSDIKLTDDEFEPENNFEPSGITPPVISKWTERNETVVYGSGDEQNENGGFETIATKFNPHSRIGYAIPTIGKSIEEIQEGVNVFIEYAKNNPDMRFHVRKVGYGKAGYTVEQIAPLFSEARIVKNILLPSAIIDLLN